MLPELIEIVPPPGPVSAEVTVPGSKSVTNRALILAALGRGTTTLRGALWSEDTQVMATCLGRLGFEIETSPDPEEPANRNLRVRGLGGRIPRSGSAAAPLELHVGNAGTAARFLSALVCLGPGYYRLSGVPRMHERPQAELFGALRQLGYVVESPNDRLPATLRGEGPRPGSCRVNARESSQFASALILGSKVGRWDVEVSTDGGDAEELPYVEMTRRMVAAFPTRGGEFVVEPDASSGSYFWAAGQVADGGPGGTSRVTVARWPTSGWQADAAFPRFLPLPERISRATDLADSIMTAIVLAPFAAAPRRFTELGRLRVQECERVAALHTELEKCGARVEETGDTLTVWPSTLRGAEVETYGDHRMAMCFAVVGLRVPGIQLRDPGCVRKTFPNFFAKLAAAPPRGLGIAVRDPRSGELLAGDLLLAD